MTEVLIYAMNKWIIVCVCVYSYAFLYVCVCVSMGIWNVCNVLVIPALLLLITHTADNVMLDSEPINCNKTILTITCSIILQPN